MDGKTLHFHAEAVWRRNMIMRDRETGTLWQHATGEALIGPLEGSRLEVLGGERITWAGWREQYPDTKIAVAPDEWPGVLPLSVTMKILEFATRSGRVPGLTLTDDRLPQNEEIVGVSLAGEACAYPVASLRRHEVLNDMVGGIPIVVVYRSRTEQVGIFRRPAEQISLSAQGEFLMSEDGAMHWDRRGQPLSGTNKSLQPVRYERQWWSAWYEFHPGTGVKIS